MMFNYSTAYTCKFCLHNHDEIAEQFTLYISPLKNKYF